MAIRYKIDVMDELKKAGYNPTTIRKNKLMGEARLQQIREKQLVSWATMNTLCRILKKQPGDILEYVPDEGKAE